MPGGFADIFRCSVWNIKMGAAVFHALCDFVLQLCGVFDILQKNLTVTAHFIKSYFRMMTKAETYDIIKAILCKIDCDINHDFQEERHTMSKRVLSLLMALALCFSMLPAAVLAEENAAVQDLADVGDIYAGGEDTELTDGGVQNGEGDIAAPAVQALIDALPDEVTADNTEELQAQLIAIDETLAELDDEQLAAL